MCGSRKYPYPHHGGIENFKGVGGSKAKEIPEGWGLTVQLTSSWFSSQFDSVPTQWSLENLLPTDFGGMFWSFERSLQRVYKGLRMACKGFMKRITLTTLYTISTWPVKTKVIPSKFWVFANIPKKDPKCTSLYLFSSLWTKLLKWMKV